MGIFLFILSDMYLYYVLFMHVNNKLHFDLQVFTSDFFSSIVYAIQTKKTYCNLCLPWCYPQLLQCKNDLLHLKVLSIFIF